MVQSTSRTQGAQSLKLSLEPVAIFETGHLEVCTDMCLCVSKTQNEYSVDLDDNYGK